MADGHHRRIPEVVDRRGVPRRRRGLMLVMFAAGVGSLAWMVLLTAAMIAEKMLPGGRCLARPLGVALFAAVPLAVMLLGAVV